MPSTDRQNRLIVSEDWKRIYQSFRNADFQSYDFDNLRRVMVSYLRENYPEDFNDYIESSEYLALIDLIAFLGQNLAFRFDLNARDNFLELAERRESVLRLARLLSYNAKRNISANGLLKFNAVQTTETITDSNGRNMSGQTILWNDSANPNWKDQFDRVLNAALPTNSQIGKPIDTQVISGVPTDQYRFNSNNPGLPVYSFVKSIDGRNVIFEIVSSSFYQTDYIFEEPPLDGNSLAFLYRNDGRGAASTNSGYFAYFKQGTIQTGEFTLTRPTTNQTVDLDAVNINNDDIWLYSLDETGIEQDLWSKVDSVEGNNIIYNSVKKDIRKIFSVLTRSSDRVSLLFSDGVFGDLPQGTFKVYYRTSNNLSYVINPKDIKSISIDVPYISSTGTQETLTITLGLKYTVNNASASETSESIKSNAPATYYTQGRMITGEDYNVLPLSINQEILKIKSINRVSSGISRFFDLKDTTGKYSHTNLFGADGIIYKEYRDKTTTFTFRNTTDISSVISNIIEPIITSREVQDFYIDKFPRINFSTKDYYFSTVTLATNRSTGFFVETYPVLNSTSALSLGSFTDSKLTHIVPNALVKFQVTPVRAGTFVPGYTYTITSLGTTNFKSCGAKNNVVGETFVAINTGTGTGTAKFGTSDYIWSKVISVAGSGLGVENSGIQASGLGTVTFNDIIPSGSKIVEIITKYSLSFSTDLKSRLINLIYNNSDLGIRYDNDSYEWKAISQSNLDRISSFSLDDAGNITSQQKDASWIILLETDGSYYTVTYRTARYVFESEEEIRFFFDSTDKVYDSNSGKIIKDSVTVLSVNKDPTTDQSLLLDYRWSILDSCKGVNGYIDTKKIVIGFNDSDDDGIIDNPDIFDIVVSPDTDVVMKYIFQKKKISTDGSVDFFYYKNSDDFIKVYETTSDIDKTTIVSDQLVYIIDKNLVKNFKYLGYITGGSGYVSGVYEGKILKYESGTVPTALPIVDITVINGVVTTVNVNTSGIGDGVDTVYSLNSDKLGGSGSGFILESLKLNSDYKGFVGRDGLKFQYIHAAGNASRLDPSSTNIIDIHMLTRTYDLDYRRWIKGEISNKPAALTSDQLYTSFSGSLKNIKSISDEIVFHPVTYKNLFGSSAELSLQAKFKVVKNINVTVSDNDIKSSVVSAINDFFEVDNWDFGDVFYFSELSTYIMNKLAPNISSIVIVPVQGDSVFGNLYEIQSNADEIFISSADVTDVDIIDEITLSSIKATSNVS